MNTDTIFLFQSFFGCKVFCEESLVTSQQSQKFFTWPPTAGKKQQAHFSKIHPFLFHCFIFMNESHKKYYMVIFFLSFFFF